jgi:hypothetical protein
MISTFRNPAGIEIKMETLFEPKEVDRLLKRCFRVDVYTDLKAKAARYEELFLEITVGRRAEFPEVRHLLIHLDNRPDSAALLPGAVRGNFVIVFYVDKAHLAEIRPMVDYLKSTLKSTNDWPATKAFALDQDKISDLPSFEL